MNRILTAFCVLFLLIVCEKAISPDSNNETVSMQTIEDVTLGLHDIKSYYNLQGPVATISIYTTDSLISTKTIITIIQDTIHFELDNKGKQTIQDQPGIGKWTFIYEYDTHGNFTKILKEFWSYSKQESSDSYTDYKYDKNNNVITVNTNNGTNYYYKYEKNIDSVFQYQYSASSNSEIAFAIYDISGLPLIYERSNGTIIEKYNKGRKVSFLNINNNNLEIDYSYDDVGNLLDEKWSNGNTYKYQYSEYDSYGNYTKVRKMLYNSSDILKEITNVKREITYN